MAGKMVLPLLGGTPAVWTTCMVFFQAALLAGYAYAHGLITLASPRWQIGVHAGLALASLAALPVAIPAQGPAAEAHPALWLLGRLALSLGLPLFFVCSTAPLVQGWFARSGHVRAPDPYFLYAASNAGSLFALLAYPLVVERQLSLPDQARWWATAYLVLAALVTGCAVVARGRGTDLAAASGRAAEPVTWGRRARWLAAALVPSSLLLGVTGHVTTNVAAVPLLWVVPLALYLATYIAAFSRRAPLLHGAMVRAYPGVLLVLGPLVFFDLRDLTWMAIVPHLLLFLAAAWVCHGELARLRPGAAGLTEFYLWVAAGGVLGGMFNALLAPLLFDTVAEYPLMIAASAMLLPTAGGGDAGERRFRAADFVLPAALATVSAAAVLAFGVRFSGGRWQPAAVLAAALAAAVFALRGRSPRFGAGYAVFLGTVSAMTSVAPANLLHAERNFFGVKRVVIDDTGQFHRFVHGSTTHGTQWIDPARHGEPTAYYDRRGPAGDLFAALAAEGRPENVAIVGLGAGGLACYAEPGQLFTFYEIDPAVERIARDARWFSYLADCGPRCAVALGDGRLQLARIAPAHYGLIVLDAFGSDAVPAHLLSREALDVYLDKLAADGVLLFHVTNAYLDLAPVVARLAEDAGLVALHRTDPAADPEALQSGRMPTHYVAMARNAEALRSLSGRPGWRPLLATPGTPLWTDRYCDLVGAFRAPRRPAVASVPSRK